MTAHAALADAYVAPADHPLTSAPDNLNLLVAFYNSQKIVRFELKPEGSTYQATEHEFFTLDRKGAHL